MKPVLKLAYIVGLSLILLNGCDNSIPAEESPTLTALMPLAEKNSNQQLEIMNPWITGGGKDAFEALAEVYTRMNPGVELINVADTGRSYPELIAFFDESLRKQQPFDSWQVHPGDEVINHVIPGQVEPLTQLFKNQGLDQVLPPVLIEQITINGEIYSIPVNIHRSNVLWYNPCIFEANHLSPPESLEEFFEVARALEDSHIVPLAIGGNLGFEVGHLFESILLATFGPGDYMRLFQAGNDMWEDPRALEAIITLQDMLAYTNGNHLEINYQAAAEMVADGEAAMTVMGDWIEGYLKAGGKVLKQDFAWAPAPGTTGTFIWISDGFVLATGAENREAALAWLEVVGSKEGQDAFNPIKGSIPARMDADRILYDEYLQWSMDQFAEDTLVPSVVHGAAAPQSYLVAYSDALSAFSKDLDAAKLLQALQTAVAELD